MLQYQCLAACRYGLSKRYYCSKTKSTNCVKTSPSPEQAGTNWRSFLIVWLWYRFFHLFQDAQYLSTSSTTSLWNAFLLITFISDLFVQPGLAGLGLTGIGGLLFLFHDNDQRRAVLKGICVFFPELSVLKCTICMFCSLYIFQIKTFYSGKVCWWWNNLISYRLHWIVFYY